MIGTVDDQTGQRLLVDLVNTRHVPDGDDVLSGARALSWLTERGATGDRVDPAALESLRQLREGLRQLALANNGYEPDPDTLEGARAALPALQVSVRLGDQRQSPALVAPPGADPVRQVIARILTAYLAERSAGRWARIKACAAPDCQFAYADTSRNASRRWCDMADCGNRAKNRSWRARQVASRG